MSVEPVNPASLPEQGILADLERSRQLYNAKDKTAEGFAKNALYKAVAANNPQLIVQSYLQLCIVQLDLFFDYLKGFEYAKLALENLSVNTPPLLVAEVNLQVATCYQNLRDYATANSFMYEALRILESLEENPEVVRSKCKLFYVLATLNYKLGLYSLGREFIEKSLTYAERMNDVGAIYRSWLTLGNYYLYEEKNDEALAYYARLLDNIDLLPNDEMKAVANHYTGLAHFRKGNYAEAEKYYTRGYQIRLKAGNESRLMFSYYGLANTSFKLGKPEEGKTYIDKLLTDIEKYPHMLDDQSRNDVLQTVYYLLGDFEKAYYYLDKIEKGMVNHTVIENTIRTIFDNERIKQDNIKNEAEQLKRLNADMSEYSKQLESSNKDLKTYAHTTSHDLREPLRMISTYMTILEAKLSSKLTEEEKNFMRFAVDGSKRMDEMITRILNAAKSGQNVTLKPVELNKVAETVKTNLARLATEKNAVINTGNLPMIMADDIQMLQVFQNLVTNAIKYNNSPQPTIDITCHKQGDVYELSIADNGVGIPEAERQGVFEMFKRVENPSGADGTGIGLSTVKNIVEKMKGKIWIEGNHPHGTIFKIQFKAGI